MVRSGSWSWHKALEKKPRLYSKCHKLRIAFNGNCVNKHTRGVDKEKRVSNDVDMSID